MTQEEKQLLLKDLCARLPYGVHVDIYSWQKDSPKLLVECIPEYVGEEIVVKNIVGRHPIKEVKPYLRPMSSMTEEERKELSKILNYEFYVDDDFALVAEDDRHRIRFELCKDYIDWLVSHHFDYHGLIPMNLALEAKEGMYKTE